MSDPQVWLWCIRKITSKDTANLISFPCKESVKCKLQDRQEAHILHKLEEHVHKHSSRYSWESGTSNNIFSTEFLFSSMSYATHLFKQLSVYVLVQHTHIPYFCIVDRKAFFIILTHCLTEENLSSSKVTENWVTNKWADLTSHIPIASYKRQSWRHQSYLFVKLRVSNLWIHATHSPSFPCCVILISSYCPTNFT